MRALLAAVWNMGSAVPARAAHLFARAQFCDKTNWTFAEYDAAAAGDIEFQRDYWKMTESWHGDDKAEHA